MKQPRTAALDDEGWRMKTLLLRVSADRGLRQLAQATGKTQTDLIRAAVDDLLQKHVSELQA